MDNYPITKSAASILLTDYGEFTIEIYVDREGREHVVLSRGQFSALEPVLVRVHSECITGEVFHSRHCDCKSQLDKALQMIGAASAGAVIYLRQEGRDIGLSNKIKAYDLQRQGLDTVVANEQLGFLPDARTYEVAAAILESLGIRTVRLMTNNPDKVEQLSALGITVAERVPLAVPPNGVDDAYLEAKRIKLGHWLETI